MLQFLRELQLQFFQHWIEKAENECNPHKFRSQLTEIELISNVAEWDGQGPQLS